MSRPTLSAIMPNYNYGQYIGEALEAVLTQSFAADEVIVVDDASTDDSVSIIRQFMKKYPNLKLIMNETNMGAGYSLKKGLSIAKGDYFSAPGSDDKLLSGSFEKMMDILTRYPQSGLCSSDSLINKSGQIFENRSYLSDKLCYFPPDAVVELYMREAFAPIQHNTLIMKRSAFNEAGGYISRFKWQADSFVANVICFRHGFCYVPEPLAMVRMHSNQYGASNAGKSRQEREVIKDMMDTLMTDPSYSDVLPKFKRTAPFSCYPWEVFMVAISDRKCAGFLSFKLLKFAFFDKFIARPLRRIWAILPVPVINILRGLFRGIKYLRSRANKRTGTF